MNTQLFNVYEKRFYIIKIIKTNLNYFIQYRNWIYKSNISCYQRDINLKNLKWNEYWKHCFQKKIKNLIIIYADNQKAIKLINNSIFQKKIKYITIKYYYTRDLINKKIIKLKYRFTNEMITDELIKSLKSKQFKKFVKQLDMTKRLMNWLIKNDH